MVAKDGSQENRTGRSKERAVAVEGKGTTTKASVPPTRSWWLIAKDGAAGTEPFAVEGDGGRVVPVFGFREEAEMFLRLGALGEGWRIGETEGGELLSILGGPRAQVTKVALDPLPVAVGEVALVDLLAIDQEAFRRTLVGGRWSPRKRPGPGGTEGQ